MASSTQELLPNEIGGLDDPVNIRIMDVDTFVYENKVMPVDSSLVWEPSTNEFHEAGLYSETIFGAIGSPERMLRFGYIELNTQIFSPKIFKIITQLGSLYKDIMAGSAYAVFDPISKDFVRVVGDPMDTPGADTGYTFFQRNFHELSFKKNASSQRDERIQVVQRYRQFALQTKYIVEPAGLRDISQDGTGRLVQDEVNKLYTSLYLYAKAIPRGSKSPLYDAVRYQVQAKAQEVYEYIENFLDGKRGFIQGSFARRKIALGTRNVITAATNTAASPEDPQLLKADDIQVGVYQTIKGLQPATKFAWNALFGVPIFKVEYTTNVALTDPKTGKLVYTAISPAERDKWTASEMIDKLINNFEDPELRAKPVYIKDETGKDYALLLVYDEGDTVAFCRSIDDLEKRWPRKIDRRRLRPITYLEVFYVIAEVISMGKHAMVTRYPVIEQGSCYPAKVHVVSTTPSRNVQLIDLLSEGLHPTTMRQYPVIGAGCMDACMVHPSKLAALGGDHDGDKISVDFVLTDDGNAECAAYLESTRSVLNTELRFISGGSNYLIDQVLHCLTHA